VQNDGQLSFRDLTRFNGFELLAWDFNPRWAMRSSVDTQPPKIDRIYRKVKDEVALEAWLIVAENQQTFLEEWQRYHEN
jgi:hypothetical protein